MLFSIIVCTYNRDAYIYRALEHVAKNRFPYEDYEVLLIDNNSTDNTKSECNRFQQAYSQVQYRYIVEEKQGLSNARNRGIAEAAGQWLIFIDDDAFMHDDYLSQLQAYLQAHPDTMSFGGRIDPLYENGEEPAWMNPWMYSIISAIDMGAEVKPFDKKYPIGANMGFHKDCLKAVGSFNPKLGRSKKNLIGGEEKELFGKIKEAGMPVYYFPKVIVQHVIPENRTTEDYIRRVGDGIGQSERIRTSRSKKAYLKRGFLEAVKWAGSLVLWCWYQLKGQSIKAKMIIVFRYHITKAFLGK